MSGTLSLCTTIAARSILVERRAGEALFVVAPFGAVALLVIPIAVGTDVPLLRQVGPPMYWVVLLLFGVFVVLRQSSLQTPAQAHFLVLAAVPGAIQVLGNVMATAVLLLGFGVVLAPVAVMLYDPDVTGWPWFLLVLVAVSGGLALLGAVVDAVVRWLDLRATLGPLLIVPLAVPLLLGATQTMAAVALGRSAVPWLLLILLVDLLLLLAAILAGHLLEDAK